MLRLLVRTKTILDTSRIQSVKVHRYDLMILFLTCPKSSTSIRACFLTVEDKPGIADNLACIIQKKSGYIHITFRISDVPSQICPDSCNPGIGFERNLLSLSSRIF